MHTTGRRILGAGIAISITIAAGLVVWNQVRYRFIPRNYGAVEPGQIYRGGQLSAGLVTQWLSAHSIDKILFMSIDKENRPDVQAELAAARALGIERLNLPLGGKGTGDPMQYVLAIEEMAESVRQGQQVLVHCHSGAQRTGGAVALYRVLVQGWAGEDAYEEMLTFKHDPDDNPALLPFLNDNMRWIAQKLVERGVIEELPDPLPVLGP
jgi:protein tyrosine/serine phosphatase